MRSNDLTAEQLVKLGESLRAQYAFYERLRKRMAALHFPDGDPLWRQLFRTMRAVHDMQGGLWQLSEELRKPPPKLPVDDNEIPY